MRRRSFLKGLGAALVLVNLTLGQDAVAGEIVAQGGGRTPDLTSLDAALKEYYTPAMGKMLEARNHPAGAFLEMMPRPEVGDVLFMGPQPLTPADIPGLQMWGTADRGINIGGVFHGW